MLVYCPAPGAIADVQQHIKPHADDRPVWLFRRWDPAHKVDEYPRELAAVRNGALDGYLIWELNCFFEPQSPMRKLLEIIGSRKGR